MYTSALFFESEKKWLPIRDYYFLHNDDHDIHVQHHYFFVPT